jgi:CHRD domain-containing protein
MTNKLSNIVVAFVLGGALVAGTVGGTSCDDDDTNVVVNVGGRGGTTGVGGGSGGATGTGGAVNVNTYSMQLSGSQEVPANASTATADVTVRLNTNTGQVTVAGSFAGLTSNATAAHIHGPAAVGQNADILIPLTVPTDATSGAVAGTASMTTPQMNDMIGGMTYVNIHSVNYPMGEIRAQIVP